MRNNRAINAYGSEGSGKMCIQEVVNNLQTLKEYEKKVGVLAFEKEKMLDDMVDENLITKQPVPRWMMKKIDSGEC